MRTSSTKQLPTRTKKRKRTLIGRFLVIDPRVCHGQLTFRDTRLPVETVLNWMAKGVSIEEILEDWPYLTKEMVQEALQHATQALLARHKPKREVG